MEPGWAARTKLGFRRRLPSLLALGLVVMTAKTAEAGTSSLDAANLSPVVQVYGLPRITQGPDPAAETRLHLGVDWANHAVSDGSGRPFARFDGETQRLALTTTGPFSAQWGSWWALEAPWLAHNGGVLDGAIEAWHDALGLPQGDRADRRHNELRYRVVDASGKEILKRTQAAAGPGDVAFSAGFPVRGMAGPWNSASAGLRIEVPTGDPDRLLGSGSWDVASWLASDGRLDASGAWGWHVAGGVLYMTDSDVLPDLHRNWAGFGRAGVNLSWLDTLSLTAQLDGHTPMYDSSLDPLGGATIQLGLGAAWEPGAGYRAEAGFSEDLAVGTAPDITLHLRLSRSYAGSRTIP
ncbi:DUF3187 family protein [Thiohalorhabdus sp.]|uniref:DUF3187 family protein n=1 Tax=Thiohalorhabdus sp. TaxID=3094134 RepID=UPI002FC3A0CA